MKWLPDPLAGTRLAPHGSFHDTNRHTPLAGSMQRTRAAGGREGGSAAAGEVAVGVRADDRGERLDLAELGAGAAPPGRPGPRPAAGRGGQPRGGGSSAGESIVIRRLNTLKRKTSCVLFS